VNINSLEITTDFSKTINDRSTLRLLRKLEKKHSEAEVVHVILDNASYTVAGKAIGFALPATI
ncbi:MAG: hypothetical protein LBJ00_13840, partial [Planctomycetaceae bacterium]|jgi:hypothetical protein|nr:hypothetical protein [Planctomycetaceae bacterium]